jgi:hypothetical protein
MSLLFFNPWNDLALASGDAHYTPPASAMQMAQDLRDLPQLWAPHDSRRLSVWGWSPLLVTQLREKGVDEALLPSAEQMAAYRAASSRQTAVRLLARWRERFPEAFGNGALVGESKMCMTLQEVLAAVTAYGNEAMLKAPWSGSGRGVHPVHGGVSDKNLAWVTRTLQRQGGVEVEPSYNKVVDFAMEFWSENGQVRYEGLSLFTTTAGGVYSGNLVASEQEKEQRLVAYIPLEQLAEVRRQLTALLNEALSNELLPAWYTGPFGVDMMVVARPDANGFLLHPCVEVNLRRTMGHVALAIGRRGVMQVVYSDNHYKLKIIPLCEN